MDGRDEALTDDPTISKTVGWFAAKMLEKLRRPKNAAKEGWQDMLTDELLSRLHEEVAELEDQIAFANVGERNTDRIISECCDVADFAMMIADCARRHEERLAGR